MNEITFSELYAPVGSSVLIRKVSRQMKHEYGVMCSMPQYETVYGSLDSAIVQKWSKKGYVLLSFRNQTLWVDPKEYELCEVL